MNKEEIKKIVLDYINKNESASYAELQWLFDQHGYNYKGTLMSCADACEHVVFWSDWNAEAFDLMAELLHEGVVHREPAHPLRYLLDGAALTLPKVRRAVQYKTDHWAPVVFVKGPGAS
ncbi:MAG: hypothetical protein LIP16_10210 [Clostridium sp.]|nr:hypothetical protein [Clostridium sp.]